jgi:O-antigen/teichoic acid export membrane protein
MMRGPWRRLASQSAVIFGGRIAGAGVTFLAQAAIARFWGADLLGEYLILVATSNLIGVTMPLGFHTIGTYFTAEYRARGDGRSLRAFLIRAYGHVAIVALLLGIFGAPFAMLAGTPGQILASHWIPIVLLALSVGMIFVSGTVLVGLKRPYSGYFADAIFRPVAVISAFIFCVGLGEPGEGFALMVWIMAVACVIISLGQFAIVVHAARQVPVTAEPPARQVRRWWRFAVPWAMIAIATDFFFDIDLLLLSGHMDKAELAIFGVCTRLFSLVSFGVAAVYAVTVPDIFEAEAMSDREGFNRKVGDANLVASVLSIALFVGTIIVGPIALMLFGPDFLAGSVPLAILTLALVVRSIFGPASMVLSINDKPYASLPSIALGMATLVGGNLVLVPIWGLTGAALAALVGITVWSLALWRTAYRAARIDVSIFPRLRALRAAQAA